MTLFEKALVAHLVGDWILQNDWMARHKSNLLHPASWVHGCIHFLLLTLALGWKAGLTIAFLHMIVDTRVPQRWWNKVFKQTTNGATGLHVLIWGDQVIHITIIALWLLLSPSFLAT